MAPLSVGHFGTIPMPTPSSSYTHTQCPATKSPLIGSNKGTVYSAGRGLVGGLSEEKCHVEDRRFNLRTG